jgi:CubicO group peptidase (beta-lactamase class C family)
MARLPRLASIIFLLTCGTFALPAAPDAPPTALTNDETLASVLRSIREKHGVPALGGAIVTSAGLQLVAVDGVRKRGEAEPVTVNDLWHLGSDTKAMTATMLAALVEQGKITWETKLGDVFPDLKLSREKQQITLLQLLSHRAGLPANTDWRELSRSGTLVHQRQAAVARLASTKLLSAPGTEFLYSNWGYVAAAAMAERVTGESYETLMHQLVFKPLQMHSVGYGSPGKRDELTEPWGHTATRRPTQDDNPLLIAPAGCVHCSLEDWAKFIADQLRGASGRPALLKPESYTRLHTAPFNGDYALGWRTTQRGWAGGEVLTHAGSNTMNFCVVWLAPKRDFAVLAVCNQGEEAVTCDDVCGALIKRHQKPAPAP